MTKSLEPTQLPQDAALPESRTATRANHTSQSLEKCLVKNGSILETISNHVIICLLGRGGFFGSFFNQPSSTALQGFYHECQIQSPFNLFRKNNPALL